VSLPEKTDKVRFEICKNQIDFSPTTFITDHRIKFNLNPLIISGDEYAEAQVDMISPLVSILCILSKEQIKHTLTL
jgi:hypothetical protein